MSAETLLETCMGGVDIDASMGPRSRERGNLIDALSLADLQPASMGPRSRERGNEKDEVLPKNPTSG